MRRASERTVWMIRAETFCIAEESFLNTILRQKVESARNPLQNPVIPEFCDVFHADFLQVSANCLRSWLVVMMIWQFFSPAAWRSISRKEVSSTDCCCGSSNISRPG